MPSKFKERLPNLYKDHGIADLTMGLYTKDANLDSVWNDISQEPLEFAQKYIGKDFMQEMRETSKGGYLYVIRLVKEFLKVFSDIENVMKESESVEITDMIDRIMKLGRNIGFKDSLIHELTMSSIPTPGTSKTTDPFISLKAFAYLFTLLPLEWSHMRKEYFLFPGGSVLYETVICRLIWITLHCIVDSIRFHFEIKIDKNNVIKAISSKNPALRPKKLPKMDIPIVEQRQPLLQTPQIKTSDVPPNISLTTFPSKSKSNPNPTIFNTIPKTQHIYAESFLQVSKKEFCRTSSNNSLIYSLINDANPNINLIIHPDLATMLPSATKIFFENYLQKIAAKLKNTISCGEVKYLTEKTMNITKKPYIFEMNENVNIRFHQKLGTLVHMLARTILNTEEFEAAPEMFEIFAPIFTVGRSEYIFSTNKTTSIFSHVGKECIGQIERLVEDSPNKNRLAFHIRGCLFRFLISFCASLIRFICNVKLNSKLEIERFVFDDFEFGANVIGPLDKPVKSEPAPSLTTKSEPKTSEPGNVEVTDEELEAARSLRPPSTTTTSSYLNNCPATPMFREFWERAKVDDRLSDKWKETIRNILISNKQLAVDRDKAEQQYEVARNV